MIEALCDSVVRCPASARRQRDHDESSMNQSPIAELIAQSRNPAIPNQSLNLQSPIAQWP
jgi:hypothetical protein